MSNLRYLVPVPWLDCMRRICDERTQYHFFLAVLAERVKLALVGAPFAPGFLIFSPEPAAIRLRFACMLAYNPFFAISISIYYVQLFLSHQTNHEI